jgi:lipoyl synthase
VKEPEEVLELMNDLVKCRMRYSYNRTVSSAHKVHLPVDRFVTPEEFRMYKEEGLKKGFRIVESSPLVRSSYHADEQARAVFK